MFQVDWNKLIHWELPAAVDKPKVFGLFKALISPVSFLHAMFLSFREATYWNIHTNGQKTKLQFGLNRIFDPILSRINILDEPEAPNVFIYTHYENEPLYLPQFIAGSQYDFRVEVPAALMSQEADIKSYINRFKLVTKSYHIIYI